MNKLSKLKPPKELAAAGGFRQREKLGGIWRRLITKRGRLRPNGAVLDLGCGLGRMAVPLTEYLTPRGRYEGLDVDAKAIAWCQANIGAAHANFRFTLVDVKNCYNPTGKMSADSFAFPYADSTFDVVFLASVFTHLMPGAVSRYLQEIWRVLKPGGRCLASYFILNEDSEKAIAESRVNPLHAFPQQAEGCRVYSLEMPEGAVAYEENRLREMYADSGLSIIDPIYYGSWAGHEAAHGQDVILAMRPELLKAVE